MGQLRFRCPACGRRLGADSAACRCGWAARYRVKIVGDPSHLAGLLPRALGSRGVPTPAAAVQQHQDGAAVDVDAAQLPTVLTVARVHDLRDHVIAPIAADGALGEPVVPARSRSSAAPVLIGALALGAAALGVWQLRASSPARGDAAQATAGPDAGVEPPPPMPSPPHRVTAGNEAKLIDEAIAASAAASVVEIVSERGVPGAGFVTGSATHVVSLAPELTKAAKANVVGLGGLATASVIRTHPSGTVLLEQTGDASGSAAALGAASDLEADALVFTVGLVRQRRDFAVRVGRVKKALVWRGRQPHFDAPAALSGTFPGAPVFDAEGRVVGVSTGGAEPLALYAEATYLEAGVLSELLGTLPVPTAYAAVLAEEEADAPEEADEADEGPDTGSREALVAEGPLWASPTAGTRRSCPERQVAWSRYCRRNLRFLLAYLSPDGAPGERGSVTLRFLRSAVDDGTGPADLIGQRTEWKQPRWEASRTARALLARRAGVPAVDVRKVYIAVVDFDGQDAYRVLNAAQRLNGRLVVRYNGQVSGVARLTP